MYAQPDPSFFLLWKRHAFCPLVFTSQNSFTSIKLASNNYLLWKAQVILILRGHGLFGYVTNDISCPDSTIAGADGTLQPNLVVATWLRTN
jgi:hypothetical protein